MRRATPAALPLSWVCSRLERGRTSKAARQRQNCDGGVTLCAVSNRSRLRALRMLTVVKAPGVAIRLVSLQIHRAAGANGFLRVRDVARQ